MKSPLLLFSGLLFILTGIVQGCSHKLDALEIAARKKAVEDSLSAADSTANACCGCEYYCNVLCAAEVDSIVKADRITYSQAEEKLRARNKLRAQQDKPAFYSPVPIQRTPGN
jgi:hypothetical protein